jgi:TetR/AcrR family transcriptional repressor of nem operon
MRVSKEEAARNRHKILVAAGRLFRERGINATGVDAITQRAGLTHGAVYSQFGSKEAIVTEAIRAALNRAKKGWQHLGEPNAGNDALNEIVEQYLSRRHRDSAGKGCVVASLGSEIARQPDRVRTAFTAEMKAALKLLARHIPEQKSSRRYDDAIEVFASMVGGLILARAISDERLSDRILKTTASRLIGRADRKSPRKSKRRA